MSDLLKPGDMFLEYRLLAVIGEGGMGIVFKAVHEEYDDVVAIKVLSPAHAARKDFAARFRQECKFYPKLKHPHIVRMRRAGVAQVVARLATAKGAQPSPVPVAFIVMDLLEGKTLRRILNRYHRLDYLNTLHVMIQIAEAVRFAHLKGIVHRDLKPENIMVGTVGDEKGWVWLMDFGIAKGGESGVRTEDMPDMGTARYMAPEQVRNIFSAARKSERVHLDHRIDVYAFGVIFYEVITGQHTFINDEDPPTFEETLTGHLLAEPRPIYELVPDCPEHLDDLWLIIQKCIAIDPDERYESFDDVLGDLQALIRNSVPTTHPLGKRIVAEKASDERRAAFGSLPKVPTTKVPADAEPSGREALAPAPPLMPEEQGPSHTADITREEVLSSPAERSVAWAETVPASGADQPTRPEPGARLTAPLVDYVPRANPLPFVPAAAPFVPSVPLLKPALGVRGTVKMERPEIPPASASPSARRPQGTIPMRPAAPMPAVAALNAAPPGNVAFGMAAPSVPTWNAHLSAAAYAPVRPAPVQPIPMPLPTMPAAPRTETAFTVGRVDAHGSRVSPAAVPPFLEHGRSTTSSQPTLSTPSSMTARPRTSRRRLLLAPLLGLVIVLMASTAIFAVVRSQAHPSPAPASPPPLPGPVVAAGPSTAVSEAPPAASPAEVPSDAPTTKPEPTVSASAPRSRAPTSRAPKAAAPRRTPARTPVIPLVVD